MPKVKRGPFSKAELYYIKDNPDVLDATSLAKELNRPVGQVQKLMDDAEPDLNESLEERQTKPTTTTIKDETHMRQMMGRHMRNGKQTSTIMTPAASELSDDLRKNQTKPTPSYIHKPLGDD